MEALGGLGNRSGHGARHAVIVGTSSSTVEKMSTFAWFLRFPQWLERAWQETRVDPPDTVLSTMLFEDTAPAELEKSPDIVC
jgi:hypothetical protein